MKKSLFALGGFLLLMLILPTASAHKTPESGTNVPPAGAAHALATPTPPAKAQQEPADVSAEAATAPAGAAFDSALLPRESRAQPLSVREGKRRRAMPSDIDPETLRQLKQQPFTRSPAPPSYTTHEDAAAKPTAGTPAPLAPTQVRAFTGPDSDDQLDGFLHGPPDTDMAAGQSHVVVVVNSLVAVYSKTGTRLRANSLASWFSNVCSGCRPFDPRVVYDPAAGRWVMMALEYDDARSVSRLLVSVSRTSDPTGAWVNYSLDGSLTFNGENTWADYPDLSFDGIPASSGGAIYISSNQFTFGSRLFRTQMLLILPKSSLYAAGSVSYWRAFNRRNADGSQAFTLRAAKTYGNPGAEYLINTRNGGSYVSVWRVVPTYPPADINMTLQTTVNIGAYSPAPVARQPGCAATLDTGDNRIYNAVWRNNRLYAAFTEAHNWGGGTVSAVRYLKINTSTNAAEINQTYGADGLHYSFPAITTDGGENIVFAFSRTGADEFASLRYTGRLLSETTAQNSAGLKSGVQCLTGERYGDYQGAAVDPADSSKVWIYGEWAADTPGADSEWDWGTWIGQVQFGGACSYSLSPASRNVTAAGTTGSVTVTAGAGCAWTAVSNAPWLTVMSGGSGSGGGTVNYSVAANNVNASRTGTLTIAGETFTLTQAAGVCTLSSPLGFGQTASGTLGTTDCRAVNRSGSYADRYTFGGTAGQRIAVSLSSAAYDTYLYLLAPNGTVAASDDDGGDGANSRIPAASGFFTLPATGTYTIEATSYASGVTGPYALTLQAGCTYSISPTSQSFGSGGGAGSVAVTAPAGCAWTAASNSSFVTINSGASGSGNGTVGYTVAANAGASARSGTLTVAGLTFTANQAANTASNVRLSASAYGVNESARKVLVTVTRTGGTTAAASVNYATADGTASRLRDYTQTLGTLVFAPGETTKTVTVFVTNDVFAEAAETFSFALSNAAGATLGSPASATVTVTSDDAANGANPVGDAAFSADFFVRQHYVDFLNREADAPGLAFWTGDIAQCGANVQCRDVKRVNVSAAFFLSIEFQNTGYLVYRLYKSAYGDATSAGVPGTVPVIRLGEFLPDTQRIGQGVVVGAPGWPAQLEANKQAFALEFVQRARFLAAFPATLTPAQFVDRLRLNTGSALSQTERDQLVSELASNNTTAGRAAALRRVAEDATLQSNEFNRAFVLMQYYGYLRRNPDDAPDANFGGWKFWLDKLNLFGGDFQNAEMVKAFIDSAEYRQRFGP